MSEQPTNRDAELLALRDRLRQARAERGGCPPWEDLKADLLPGGAQREGREARQAHLAICPYCGEHVKEWKKTFDYESDRLGAIEKGVAQGIMRGAAGLVRSIGRSKSPERVSERTAEPVAEAPAAAPTTAATPFPAAPAQRMYVPPRPAEPKPEPAPVSSGPPTRLLVVEMAD